MSQWVERAENGAALVEVTLKKRTLGAYALNLVLVQNYKQPPKMLAIDGVHPLDTQKLSGYITVATDLGIAAKTASFEGLTEIPFASVPGERATSGGSSLAYKFIAAAPAAAPQPSVSGAIAGIAPLPDARLFYGKDDYIEIPHDLMRKSIAKRLSSAAASIPGARARKIGSRRVTEASGPPIMRQ